MLLSCSILPNPGRGTASVVPPHGNRVGRAGQSPDADHRLRDQRRPRPRRQPPHRNRRRDLHRARRPDHPTFELNNGLQVTKVDRRQGKPLQSERLTNNSTVRFTPAVPDGQRHHHHLPLRVLRHPQRGRDQPGRRHQARLSRRSHQHPALSRPLVPHDRPLHQPLHRRDAHPRPRRRAVVGAAAASPP